jgi:hypothetical protein
MDKMSGTYSTHGGNIKIHGKIWLANFIKGDHLRDDAIDWG